MKLLWEQEYLGAVTRACPAWKLGQVLSQLVDIALNSFEESNKLKAAQILLRTMIPKDWLVREMAEPERHRVLDTMTPELLDKVSQILDRTSGTESGRDSGA